MGEDKEKSEGSHCPRQSELKYESRDMKKNKTVSRITVNTAFSKHEPQRVDKGDKSLGSRVSWMISFWNSQLAELFLRTSPFFMLKRTDVCRQEWPSSSRLCANFITISVEPLLHTQRYFTGTPPSSCACDRQEWGSDITSTSSRMKKESCEVGCKRQT